MRFLRHKLWRLSRHTYHRPEIATVTNTRFMSYLLLLHSEHTYIMTAFPRNCIFCHGVAACHGFRDWSYYRPESRLVVNNKIPLLPAVVGTWVERKPIGYNQIKYLSMVRVQSKTSQKRALLTEGNQRPHAVTVSQLVILFGFWALSGIILTHIYLYTYTIGHISHILNMMRIQKSRFSLITRHHGFRIKLSGI